MPLTKNQKTKVLEELKDKIVKQKAVVFADFTGIKAKDITDLRKQLRSEGAELKVAKKTLAKIAFAEQGIEVNTKQLQGEVAVIFGYADEILPAKSANKFASKEPNFKILGGLLDNKYREAADIIALAKLPSRQELLANMVGSIAAPMSGFMSVLQGNTRGLVRVLSQIKPKQ